MSQTSPPLLHEDRSLTAMGRAVLAGEVNRVAACGVDRWVGGTQLRGGNVWRWDDQQQDVRQ